MAICKWGYKRRSRGIPVLCTDQYVLTIARNGLKLTGPFAKKGEMYFMSDPSQVFKTNPMNANRF